MDPVQEAVAGHDRPGLSFPYRDLKALQVNLPERSLGYNAVHGSAPALAVVGAKMLDHAGYALLLKTPDLGGRDLSRQEGIF